MNIKKLFSKGKKTEFKFQDGENKAVFTCNHVLENDNPILFVQHDHQGDWQFLCGQNDHENDNAKIISLKEAVSIDKTLNDLFEMPIGVGAERKRIGEKWIPFKIQSE